MRWVGINGAVWDLTSRGFGTLPNMRVLACQPPESVLRVINGLRIPILRADGRPEMTQDESGADVPAHRGLTMVESIQVAASLWASLSDARCLHLIWLQLLVVWVCHQVQQH